MITMEALPLASTHSILPREVVNSSGTRGGSKEVMAFAGVDLPFSNMQKKREARVADNNP